MNRTTEGDVRAPGDGGPLLSVESLAVEFATPTGPLRAVDGVSFAVERGETVAIVGESGSGKSTIGMAMMGLLPPGQGRVVAGKITFLGDDITHAVERTLQRLRGAHISMIFQDPLSALNPTLTVGRQVREVFTYHRGHSRAQARAAALDLLERVRIPDAARRYKQYPQQFSGGMRQRVVVAMAMALGPELIIADEPTTALDVTVQARIMDLLGDLTRGKGAGLLLISHDLAVVAGSADRVYVMYAGRVMETGRIRDVYTAPANPYTAGLLESVPTMSRVGAELTPISGSPPDPAARPTGCAFHPRCSLATDRCREETPALREVQGGRFSACHYAEEVLNRDHHSATTPRTAERA
jgi:oligopeptide/dipeptide ABC transporter ATP-binding protein